MENASRTLIPLILDGQYNALSYYLTNNEAITHISALLGGVDAILNTPPGSPADGDLYIVGTSPTGLWAGKSNQLAFYTNANWEFYPPFKGLEKLVLSPLSRYYYNGSSWISI